MTYNFDTIIDRKNTASLKWDFIKQRFKQDDALPLWVADMDFAVAKPILDAFEERIRHGVFGYTICNDDYYKAVINWMQRRHGWRIEQDWIVFTPGVVPAVNLAIQAFTKPGDKVLIQQPVYYMFMHGITENERVVVSNELVNRDGRYEIDFDDLEKKARDPEVKLFILCSPHNPVSRVWTKEELERMAGICRDNGVLVVADEIHHDLILKGTFVPYASLGDEFADNCITCTAPSKTFNLAGLHTSNIIIKNEALRKQYMHQLSRVGLFGPNTFGAIAVEAAYNQGEEWLDQLLDYLRANFDFLKTYLAKYLHGVTVTDLEATYLPWLDFSAISRDRLYFKQKILKEAKVAINAGHLFGGDSDHYQRINIACPRELLHQALDKIAAVLNRNVNADKA